MTKNNNIKKLLNGVMIGCVFCVISVFVFSLFMYFFDFPVSVESGGLYILLNLGLFISSLYAGKNVSKNGYLYGILNGIIFLFIILVLNIFLNQGNFNFFNFLLKIPLFILLCAVGGIFGANLKK